jgi:hypothetical protein
VRTFGVDRTWRAELDDPPRPSIRLDSAAWFAWLEERGSSFAYPIFDPAQGYIVGWMTVRKEARQRGGRYWVVYRRCQGTLRKVYLGASATLTQACLDRLAQTFLAASQGRRTPDGTDGDSN